LPSNTSGQSHVRFDRRHEGVGDEHRQIEIAQPAGSRLAAMKSSMSGWSQRSVAIIAPRRARAT
jgi:hypothetical protein